MTDSPDAATLSDIDRGFMRSLTADDRKVDHYIIDPYVRHAWQLLDHEHGASFSGVVGRLHRLVLVVFKPDAVVGRRILPALDAFDSWQLVPVVSQPFWFTPATTRELWRYQFNIASPQRAAVVDLLLPSTPSLAVVLEEKDESTAEVPASTRVCARKGSADPASRLEGDLRTLLRSPSTLLNFVHISDEPLDVLRELALIDVHARTDLLRAAVQGSHPAARADLARHVEALYDQVPPHDLDAASAVRRLNASSSPYVDDQPGAVDWVETIRRAGSSDLRFEARWDLLTVATHSIRNNTPGLSPVLPTMTPDDWSQSKPRAGSE